MLHGSLARDDGEAAVSRKRDGTTAVVWHILTVTVVEVCAGCASEKGRCHDTLSARVSRVVQRIWSPMLQWRDARVFISSTFRDTHGERDVLTRKARFCGRARGPRRLLHRAFFVLLSLKVRPCSQVFPRLREAFARRYINVREIDLRWGVTEAESASGKVGFWGTRTRTLRTDCQPGR
jgi:hypothetical protein